LMTPKRMCSAPRCSASMASCSRIPGKPSSRLKRSFKINRSPFTGRPPRGEFAKPDPCRSTAFPDALRLVAVRRLESATNTYALVFEKPLAIGISALHPCVGLRQNPTKPDKTRQNPTAIAINIIRFKGNEREGIQMFNYRMPILFK
jgi:hypothetical protein